MMDKQSTMKPHVKTVSKLRPKPAFIPACDNHDTAIERKKCHKGKIAPPT